MASVFLCEKGPGEGYQLRNILETLLQTRRGLTITALLQMKEKHVCLSMTKDFITDILTNVDPHQTYWKDGHSTSHPLHPTAAKSIGGLDARRSKTNPGLKNYFYLLNDSFLGTLLNEP